MKRRDMMRMLVLSIAAILAVSCATTSVTNMWRNEKYTGPAFRNVYVVAVTQKTDLRQSFEDEFSNQLEAMGVDAAACHKCIPDFSAVRVGRLMESVQANGADSLLLVRFVNSERRMDRERSEAPAASTAASGVVSENDMLSSLSEYYDPPFTRVYDVIIMQVDFFDSRTKELIWTASTETDTPGKVIRNIRSYAKTVLNRLRGQRLI